MTPDAILTADWHLRETPPLFRTFENFWEIQWGKIKFISELQQKWDCPILHAGDLFHQWKASPFLISMAIKRLPKQFYTIYGNHDLPQHNMELKDKSAVHTLEASGSVMILPGNHFGTTEPIMSIEIKGRKIMVWHVYNSLSENFWAIGNCWVAHQMQAAFPDMDVILTGDNHINFALEGQNPLLVNPGPITRQTIDVADLKPCVYAWYAKPNTIERIPIPTKPIPINTIAVERNEKRNERLESFISKLNKNWKVDVDFEENVKQFFKVNKVSKSVQQLIQAAIEGV